EKKAPVEGAKDFIPPHCLVRFIDVTVKEGFTYEYQLQVKATNPNHGNKADVAFPSLADVKELNSPWAPEKPISVTVPRDLHIYGTELDRDTLKIKTTIDKNLLGDKEVAWMEIHRWLEYTSINPEQRGRLEPVGDWCVGQVPVRRGEYIGRLESTKVPMWFPHKRKWDIAVPIYAPVKALGGPIKPPPGPKGIPVNFTTENLL